MTSVKPYTDNKGKAEQVEEMFDSIAPAYDFMNTAMSFGLHRSWRKKAIDAAIKSLKVTVPKNVLDVACGTGDVTFNLHERFPKSHVYGVDLSANMLEKARKRLEKLDQSEHKYVRFEKGDCLNLPYEDNMFNLVTVAYGVRNFEHLLKGLKEINRVLKPGGTICIIELSEPSNRVTHALYRLYARHVIPVVGRMVSGDSRAYSYLPESIAAAPQRNDMSQIMQQAGFVGCKWKSLTFGAVTYYIACKDDA